MHLDCMLDGEFPRRAWEGEKNQFNPGLSLQPTSGCKGDLLLSQPWPEVMGFCNVALKESLQLATGLLVKVTNPILSRTDPPSRLNGLWILGILPSQTCLAALPKESLTSEGTVLALLQTQSNKISSQSGVVLSCSPWMSV